MAGSTDRHGGAARRRGPAVAAVGTFLAVLAAVLAAVQAMPTKYAATSVVSFVPRPEFTAAADTVQLVGEKYVVLATSPATMRSAAAAVGAGADVLDGATSAVLGAGTGNVSITVTLADRGQAVAAANAIAEALVRASASDRLVSAEQTAPAVPSTAKVKPPRTLLRGAGLLAALLAAVLAWSLVSGMVRGRAARRPDRALAAR